MLGIKGSLLRLTLLVLISGSVVWVWGFWCFGVRAGLVGSGGLLRCVGCLGGGR